MNAYDVLTRPLARRIASQQGGTAVVLSWDDPRRRSGRSTRGGRLNSALILVAAAARQIAGQNPTIRVAGDVPVMPFRSTDAAWQYLREMAADRFARVTTEQWLAWLAKNGHTYTAVGLDR